MSRMVSHLYRQGHKQRTIYDRHIVQRQRIINGNGIDYRSWVVVYSGSSGSDNGLGERLFVLYQVPERCQGLESAGSGLSLNPVSDKHPVTQSKAGTRILTGQQ